MIRDRSKKQLPSDGRPFTFIRWKTVISSVSFASFYWLFSFWRCFQRGTFFQSFSWTSVFEIHVYVFILIKDHSLLFMSCQLKTCCFGVADTVFYSESRMCIVGHLRYSNFACKGKTFSWSWMAGIFTVWRAQWLGHHVWMHYIKNIFIIPK